MSWFFRTSLLFLFFSSFFVSRDDITALYAQSNAATEVEQLDFANGLFQRGLYGMAVTEYKNYMAAFKEGQFLADAQFGIAESLFFQHSYPEAVASYQEYLNRYFEGDKAAITQLRLGQAFFLTQQYDQALTILNQVNREVLSDGLKQTLDYYSGRVYRQKGDNKNALNALSSAVLFPEQPIFIARAFLVMGDIYLEQEKFEEAIKNYTRAFGQAQTNDLKSLALYKKGEASFTAGKYEEAAKTFKEVVAQFSDKSIANDALVNLLNAHYNLGQFENVVQEFRGYEARVSEEFRVFNIYEVTANTLLQLSEYDAALAVLNKGLNLPSITQEQKARLQQKKAESLIQSERYQEAIGLIQGELTQATIQKDQIIFLEAESYYGLGQYDQALVIYQKIVTEFPQSPMSDEAAWAIGLTQRASGKNEEALGSFLKYFETGKNDVYRASALYNVFLLETQLQKMDQAIGHAKAYLSTFPANPNNEKVLYLLGNVYSKAQHYTQAIGTFQEYIAKFKEGKRLDEVYFLLGYNQQLAGQADEALTTYNQVQGGTANNEFKYAALKNSAVIYMSKNETEKAVQSFQQITTQYQDNDLNLATFLWLAENAAKAQQYEKVLSILEGKEILAASPQEKAALAYYKGEALGGIKDYSKAIAQYDLAITAEKGGKYDVLAGLGRAAGLTMLKKFDDAGQEYQRIVEGYPDDLMASIKARFGLGEIEESKENFQGAIKYYMLVAVLFDDAEYVPMALLRAGGLFETQGQTDEAKKAYQDLINKYGQSELADQARKRMDALNEK